MSWRQLWQAMRGRYDEPRVISLDNETSPRANSHDGFSEQRLGIYRACQHPQMRSAAGAVTIAAAQLATIGSVEAQPSKTKGADLPKIKPGAHTSFSSLKQIEAGVLNVGDAGSRYSWLTVGPVPP